MQQIVFIIISLILLWIIFGRFLGKQDGVLASIIFTIEITAIVWLNIPLLITLPDGVSYTGIIGDFPFELYQKFGWGYTAVADILLAIIGSVVSSQLSKNRSKCSKKKINQHFNRFIENAVSLKVIGKDLDFLLHKDCKQQKEKILDLKDQVEILCANPYASGLVSYDKSAKLVELYHELHQSGAKIRFYDSREGISNLLGQIKIDNQKSESGFFVYKLASGDNEIIPNSKFTYEKQLNGFLLDGVVGKFKETFDRSLNPIIKFIALDLGGVYLEGDIDTFFKFLNDNYHIQINKKATDRVDLNTNLTTGKIDILDYIKETSKKGSFQKLSVQDKINIKRAWNSTWKKDEKMYRLIESIISYGFEVLPFSNLDRENGEMYLREDFFPSGCCHVFSYEKKASKSDGVLFEELVATVNQMVRKDTGSENTVSIVPEYQILLIDDQQDNIRIARQRGWETIQFNRNQGHNVDKLIELLKGKAILPQDFKLL